jgi:hypothetical protein
MGDVERSRRRGTLGRSEDADKVSSRPGGGPSATNSGALAAPTVRRPSGRRAEVGTADQRADPVFWVAVKVRLSAADLPWKVLSAVLGSEIENVR